MKASFITRCIISDNVIILSKDNLYYIIQKEFKNEKISPPPKKKVVIFGTGGTGKIVYNRICKDYDVIAFCTNNEKKQKTTFLEIPVISPFNLKEIEYDNIFIGTDMRDSVYRQLVQQLGISSDVLLDEPLKFSAYTARRFALKNAADIITHLNLKGNVAEAGVFQGEFACKINEVFYDRSLYLFDTFEGFDERDVAQEDEKVGAMINGMHPNTTPGYVMSIMPYKEKCIIKKGYFPESANGIEDSFVFVSLDMDLYLPTLEGLRFFYPKLVKGGFIFLHDFFSVRFSGVAKAVKEYSLNTDLNLSPLGDDCSIVITK